MKSFTKRVEQVILFVFSVGASGFLLDEFKLLMLVLLITILAILTYFVYRKVSQQSMVTAIIIMLILLFLGLYNEYLNIQESGMISNNFHITSYIMQFTVICTVTIMLLMKKNRTKKLP